MWSRPYQPGKGRWVIAVWELAALAFLHHTSVDLFGLGGHARAVLGVLLIVFWMLLCWRLTQLGLYVSPLGVQVRGLITKRTVAWADVDTIVVDRVVHRVGRLRIPSGRTVWIERADGTRMATTLWADGVDFKFRPALFRDVYAELRQRHVSARAAYAAVDA
jgi:hypothetical protein